jgi:TRAP transporter TAXI family solute receptor
VKSTSLRRRPAAWLAAALGVLAVGCGQGPGSAALTKEIQGKLDSQFGEGIFRVADLKRNGSYPYSEKDDPTPRLLLYYKARIDFLRDYSLTQFDKLNAGALATTLGASPAGIEGIEPDGNEKDDVLRVFGTSTYSQGSDGSWIPSGHIGRPARVEGEPRDEEGAATTGSRSERWLAEMGSMYRDLANAGKDQHLRSFEHEVWKARRSLLMRLDQLDGRLGLLTGGESSEYTAIGRTLAQVARTQKVPFRDYRSAGSVANCELVGEGRAGFGITQSDVARMAAYGTGLFAGRPPMESLRAVCSLFPEAVQVVTLTDNPRGALTDLRSLEGRRVALGAKGSGTRINAIDVLQAHGVEIGELEHAGHLSFQKSLEALEAGELDAVFMTMAYPARPIEELASRRPVRLLGLEPEVADVLSARRQGYPKVPIPAHTYPGQDEAVVSLGTTALVVTLESTPDDDVRRLLDLLLGSNQAVDQGRGQAAIRPLRPSKQVTQESRVGSFISKKSAKLGLSVPLHPAAEKYLAGGS